MLRSVLLHTGSSSEDLSGICSSLFPYANNHARWDSDLATLYFNEAGAIQPDLELHDISFFLINEHLEEADINRVQDLKEGLETWAGWITQGVAMAFAEDKIYLHNGPLATTPVYYCKSDEDILISTEIKALLKQDLVPVGAPDFSYFAKEPFFKPAGSTPIPGITKLNPNTVLTIDLKLNQISLTKLSGPAIHKHSDFDESLSNLHHDLDEWIKKQMTKGPIGIALSGGCDSGLVAGIATRHQSGFRTFTMGTEAHNEFREASQMSAFIGSVHHEIMIPEQELISAILEGIYLNEISDAEYAIGYAGLYFTYQAASGVVDQMVTGYGADLTLGNFLNVSESAIKDTAGKLLYRTSQTGELSPYVAQHFNLNIAHPFLDPGITHQIISMPTDYKVLDNGNKKVEKHIEKEMIRLHNFMPSDLIHRNKKALHTGAGIGDLFHKMAGIEINQCKKFKAAFLYEAWKRLIFEGMPPGECDPERLLIDTKKHCYEDLKRSPQ